MRFCRRRRTTRASVNPLTFIRRGGPDNHGTFARVATSRVSILDANLGPHLIAARRDDKNRLVMQRTNFRRWSEENICCGEVCRHARDPAELFGIYEAESVGMDKPALPLFELACLLVRLDHVASFILQANPRILLAAAFLCVINFFPWLLWLTLEHHSAVIAIQYD